MSGILPECGWHFEFDAVTLNKMHWTGAWEPWRMGVTSGSTWYFDPQIFVGRNILWYTGQLILGKIIKIVATSCQILRQKCTKFDFS